MAAPLAAAGAETADPSPFLECGARNTTFTPTPPRFHIFDGEIAPLQC